MNIFKHVKPGVYLVLAFMIAFVLMHSCDDEGTDQLNGWDSLSQSGITSRLVYNSPWRLK